MKPSWVMAQVDQRCPWIPSLLVAAAWNWWLGQASAIRTFTSSKTVSEGVFIDQTLNP
jgi:hypothetical protein